MPIETPNYISEDTSKTTEPEAVSVPNPFEPAALRIDPVNDIELGAKKLIVSVSVRKPSPQEFFRTHPGVDFRMTVAIIEVKETREIYLVTPRISRELAAEIRLVELRVCMSRAGTIFIWAVPLPSSDGRENAWHTSCRAAATTAEKLWVRMSANMSAGSYDVRVAPASLPDPIWGDIEFSELLRLAFGNGKLIDSLEHSVIRSLQGQL